MKKFILWLVKVFRVELPKQIVEKEVTVEKIVEKQIALEGVIEGDVTVKGNLYVTGNISVAGNISAHGGIVYGLSSDEVRMAAGKEVSCYNKKGE